MSTSENETQGLPQPGDLVAGKYRVEEILGAGAMGVVVRALHVDLAQPVAIKFLRPEIVFDKETVARFLREARAAAAVQSEHVVRVFDVAKLDTGTPYMVMEHLSGTDLNQLFGRRGPLPVAELTEYMLQACEALAQVHAAGIVHRDLKPGNLFITRRGDGSALVKVLDFGISKFVKPGPVTSTVPEPSLTRDGQFVGSIHYMSPEQLRNPRHVDSRCDIWALGAIMYKLSAGRHAFQGETLVSCIDAIMNMNPAPISSIVTEVPAEFDRVIQRCLAKSVENRFQNVADLAEALLPFARQGGEHVTKRIRGVLIGSDAISAETCFLSVAAVNGEADEPEATRRSGTTDPADLNLAAPIAIPAFRQQPTRSRRAPLMAGITAAVLAIAGFTAWRTLPGLHRGEAQALTLQLGATPIAEAARAVVAREAVLAAASTAAPPGEPAAAPEENSPAPPSSASAAPDASAALKAPSGGKTSPSGKSVAAKPGTTAAPSKTTRTRRKPAVQAPRKRPGS